MKQKKLFLSILIMFLSILFAQSQTIEEMQKILASDATTETRFGRAISVSGNYAVIGTNKGAAYIFYNNNGTWTQISTLTPSDGSGSSNFGFSVCIFDDYVVVGAYLDDDNGNNSGSAIFFFKMKEEQIIGENKPK